MKKSCVLKIRIDYDDDVTDAESLAYAMDNLLEAALSTPGILDDYGCVEISPFYILAE